METGCAIGGTISRRHYAGGRRRGLSRQPDVQLAPCAWRLSKQSGAVRGCRNGGELALEFIARGTGSARRSIGAGAARSGARVLSGSTRENAARALIDYSPRTATASLRTDRRIGRPRSWVAFGREFDPARQPGLKLRRLLDVLAADLGEHRIGDFLVAQAIETPLSGCRHMPTTRMNCRRQAPTLRANMPAAARGRDCRRPPRYSRSGDPSRANSLCRICRMRRQPCSRQGWQSPSRWLRAATRGAPWRCRSA